MRCSPPYTGKILVKQPENPGSQLVRLTKGVERKRDMLYLDIGISQLNKKGEELCGDSIEVRKSAGSTVIVLADGLASGVKANILSRITAKTAATMLKMGCHIDEVIETMANTLPVDKVRNLAYSTFTILQVFPDGRSYLAEFDNPDSYFGSGDSLHYLQRTTRKIGEKKIKEANFHLNPGDWLVMLSDGVLHAGIGRVWNFGWGEIQVGKFINKLAAMDYEAADWAGEITAHCNMLYGGLPGDDVSIVVVKARRARKLIALVGPPRESEKDLPVVEKLAGAEGFKVVCGGSTSLMVSRILDREIAIDLDSDCGTVPPAGIIEGIDLVTEGAITIYYALLHLKEGRRPRELDRARDGASRLAAALLRADEIHFMVGLAINQAIHYPGFPVSCVIKNQTVRDIAEILLSLGKKITIEYL